MNAACVVALVAAFFSLFLQKALMNDLIRSAADCDRL